MDCEKLDIAADCYINALKVRHTRAHQGLARIHFLRNDKAAAYEEMTRLIEQRVCLRAECCHTQNGHPVRPSPGLCILTRKGKQVCFMHTFIL